MKFAKPNTPKSANARIKVACACPSASMLETEDVSFPHRSLSKVAAGPKLICRALDDAGYMGPDPQEYLGLKFPMGIWHLGGSEPWGWFSSFPAVGLHSM